MADEIDKVLSKGEEVLWRGKPAKMPYLIAKALGIGSSRGGGSAVMTLFILLGVFGLFYVIFSGISSTPSGGRPALPAIGLWDAGLFLLALVILIVLLNLALAWISYDYIAYAVSNQRVIIQTGFIGRDFKSIPFNEITNPLLDVNWLGAKYDAGNVILGYGAGFSMKRPFQRYIFEWVPRPYDVLKIVNSATKSAPVTRFIK